MIHGRRQCIMVSSGWRCPYFSTWAGASDAAAAAVSAATLPPAPLAARADDAERPGSTTCDGKECPEGIQQKAATATATAVQGILSRERKSRRACRSCNAGSQHRSPRDRRGDFPGVLSAFADSVALSSADAEHPSVPNL